MFEFSPELKSAIEAIKTLQEPSPWYVRVFETATYVLFQFLKWLFFAIVIIPAVVILAFKEAVRLAVFYADWADGWVDRLE